jgi:hypothetical protein
MNTLQTAALDRHKLLGYSLLRFHQFKLSHELFPSAQKCGDVWQAGQKQERMSCSRRCNSASGLLLVWMACGKVTLSVHYVGGIQGNETLIQCHSIRHHLHLASMKVCKWKFPTIRTTDRHTDSRYIVSNCGEETVALYWGVTVLVIRLSLAFSSKTVPLVWLYCSHQEEGRSLNVKE